MSDEAPAIVQVLESHGGIASVHTRPWRDLTTGEKGWANTVVCHDGYERTLTLEEQDVLTEHQVPEEKGKWN